MDKILEDDRNLRRLEEQMRQSAVEASRSQQPAQETSLPVPPPADAEGCQTTQAVEGEEKSTDLPVSGASEVTNQPVQEEAAEGTENPASSSLLAQVEQMSISGPEEMES